MDWDFWRIDWPNIAVVFALAVVPFFVIAMPPASDEQRLSFQQVGASLPVAMLDSGSQSLGRPE
jgi:hypothetical protein